MKRKDLVLKIKEFGGFQDPNLVEKMVEFVSDSQNIGKSSISESDMGQLKQTMSKFIYKCKEKLAKCNRMYDKLFEKEESWLMVEFDFTFSQKVPVSQGRPRKSWEE